MRCHLQKIRLHEYSTFMYRNLLIITFEYTNRAPSDNWNFRFLRTAVSLQFTFEFCTLFEERLGEEISFRHGWRNRHFKSLKATMPRVDTIIGQRFFAFDHFTE